MRRAIQGESGQALVMVAIVLTALLMSVGLAIDSGQLYFAHRAMQEAADAAAYAGAVVLYQPGGTQLLAFSAAANDASLNGFSDPTQITIRQPADAPFNNASYVEVIITQSVRTSLIPQQSGLTKVTVSGIAGAEPLNNGYAIMALDRGNTINAFMNGPTGTIHLTGGGILVNSTGGPAATNNIINPAPPAPPAFTIADPYGTDVSGTAAGTWPTTGSGLRTGQPQQPDPFAGYPKPSTAGLSVNPPTIHGGTTSVSGIYTAQLSNTSLCTGTYILKAGMGGGIDIDTTAPCDGKVFLFNTNANYPSSGGLCGAFSASGNHDIVMNAMTTGTYAGLLFYQDPVCTNDAVFNGTAFSLTSTGTIYVPNAKFQITGQAQINGGQIVAKTVDTQNGQVTINFSAATSAQPKLPRLAR